MKFSSRIMGLAVLASMAGGAGAVGNLADITVYDRVENRTLPIHHHNGRYYVVGKPGNEYQVRVANRGRGEILSVISVDGVNAVSGETANWSQTGYVLGAFQAFDVRGWRKSMDRIAAFYFTEHQNSYAARTGRPDNVGVIGIAVFRKKYEPPVRIDPPPRPWPRPRHDSPFPSSQGEGAHSHDGTADSTTRSETFSAERAPPSAAAAPGRESSAQTRDGLAAGVARESRRSGPLGTGHGRSEESHVTYTNFERATSSPAEIITIHYDTYDNLLAQGVITRPSVYARPVPTPFPGQFVPDPR
jgi:hypothetical protein